ncbi:MAG: bifunctional (p)ppGpp synthetase/guanosine-3',5'-bis(diphosphate) 3'-pyrophosphohydrolase [Clostridia bacterium]
MELLKKAEDFALKVHEKQMRQSGEPYYTHPEAVAMMLFDMGMDSYTVIAGLLHDVVEDGENVTVQTLNTMFGAEISRMVDGVTKLTKTGKTSVLNKEEAQAENLRKMFLAIASDVRVVIIKLTDRLHNMRTLAPCDEEKRIRKSKETLEVYAPLAHRFGMGAVKAELEDLAFEFLYPEDYQNLKRAIEPQQRERMRTLEVAVNTIGENLKKEGIEAQVSGRPKHLYSIYKKITKQNRQLEEIYDLIAIRVIMNTVSDCYAALGVIHSVWKPVPGRFKDYIAMPKTNMYRSLHTTLFSEKGMPFEVQIRTFEMHRTAEYGIAAHWMYKEGRATQDDLDSKLAWLRESLEMEDYSTTTQEFVDSIQKDFFSDCVYVLTPRGQIIDLATGATPLDFAYRIHTNVGNRAQHAKVNGAIVRLDYKLKNNDVVEIITSPTATPSRDWMNIVKTQQAKAKIRQWFKKANRDENIQRGKEMLFESARRQGLQPAALTKADYFADILKRFNMSDMDDVYAAIGYGGVTTSQVLHKLIENHRKSEKERMLAERIEQKDTEQKPVEHKGRGIIVKGEPNMVVRFAQCCSPLPGDDIIGYVTRGRGVSIHRRDCANADDLLMDEDRIIDVEWANDVRSSYTAAIQIVANERPGVLMELSQQLANLNISIKSMTAKTDHNEVVMVQMSFDVTGADQLNSIIKNLKKVKSVTTVYRINT